MRIRTAVILFLTLAPTTICRAQEAPILSADEVIAKLIDRNAQRDKLGAGYAGSRRYVLENERLNKRAEMLVSVKCDPDGRKHFEVVSEEGWKSANKRVVHKMLESETETSQPQIRPTTSLAPENYRFQVLGKDSLDARPVYVIQVVPKREDKYLFEGRIWVDAEEFAVVRIEGKPAKNPSFWTHSIHFVQQYHKSGGFWFPLSTESVTDARIVGKTEVTISYFDYQPNSAAESSLSANSVMDQIGANHAQR
jgi:Outer membrane lipoprotein-sorting protein